MKIGILTYHQAQNYGALWQAIALRHVLSKLGNDVFFIDYVPEYRKRMYKLCDINQFLSSTWKKQIKYCIRFLPYIWRKFVFHAFINKYIYKYCQTINDRFDCIIYGSDQIWRKQPYIEDYDSMYFGQNTIGTSSHISYAASLDTLPEEEEDIKRFCSLLKNIDRISVREKQTQMFLVQHGFRNVHFCLDPTFLINKAQWEQLVSPRRIIHKRYILLFDLLADCGVKAFNCDDVRNFAKRNNAIVIKLRANLHCTESLQGRLFESPEDFINLIRYAECVLTSSYHGLVFSVIMKRPVYCCFPTSNSRMESLMSVLQMQDRIIAPENPILPPSVEPIDFTIIEERIDAYRNSSLQYLQSIVKAEIDTNEE